MADPFHALADPTRRSLLDRLYAGGGLTLRKMCDGLPISRQAVSKHIRVLEEAELVVVVPRGREKLHYLNPVPLAKIAHRWIGKFEDVRIDALADLRD
ncbi:ArsR/SmtB family transcription factor [Qipengyuania oceanensis]|uniref:Metalloregulator ArsR/SmtB family transcription factor n=1 Tax=Qipengyuania oceanensis TaxID=1463597 RepID=A0A844YKR3_9SPHN|nr:helix-turn-helix domain-containing protein [Qipengyuania oceanensis]MXO63618.1 metalloregulator ArsR/SmtB family transcription factor [Qipengyuania oceanensis]